MYTAFLYNQEWQILLRIAVEQIKVIYNIVTAIWIIYYKMLFKYTSIGCSNFVKEIVIRMEDHSFFFCFKISFSPEIDFE